MRGSLVVLALAVTPLVARVSDAQVRSHAVRHESPIAHRDDDDQDHGKSDDKQCEDRKRGNPSQNGLNHRADPRDKGNKDCSSDQQQGGGQTPPPPPAPAPVGHTSVFGSVFFDLNQDGMMGTDEVGLSGWTVTISGPVTLTTLTDGNGAYSFSGLNAGTYTVCVVPPMGWTQTAISGAPSCGTGLFGYTIDAQSLAVDISYTGIDFGFVSN